MLNDPHILKPETQTAAVMAMKTWTSVAPGRIVLYSTNTNEDNFKCEVLGSSNRGLSRRHQVFMWAAGGDVPAQRTQPISPSTPLSFPSPVTKASSHPCHPVPEVWDETSQSPFLLFSPGGSSARMCPQGYPAILARLCGPFTFWSIF